MGSHKKKMKLIPLLCIVFIKASEGCNHQNDEKLSKFHTLIRGNEISIQSTGSSQERWHIIRDSICKAKLTCKNFYIPPSEDCLKSSLEVIDGDLIKLRFCGYSSILEYEAKGKTVLDIRSTIKDGFGHVDCKLNCIENVDPATTTTVSTTPQSTTTTIENRQCQCGRSLVSERIINGQSVMNPGTYPWQALLIVNGRFTCGGSLISPKFVLTAAHCTRLAQASSIEVVLGRHNFTGETSTEPNEQRRKVSQVHIHPQFNPSMLDNDFSLLELESEIEVTDYVGSVCLPEDANEEFGAGTLAVATGWGREASIEDISRLCTSASYNCNFCLA